MRIPDCASLPIRRLVALAALAFAGWATAQAPVPEPIPSAASSAPDGAQAISLPALGAALRQGGNVIYFRHTATDFSRKDEGMKGFDDCGRQRLLPPLGRNDARAVGQHARRLRLPVGEVLASPDCRIMDTARLMFAQAQPREAIREAQGGDYPGLKRLLAVPVAPGTNRWMVGHGTPFRAIAGPPHLAEGEAAVLRPRGSGWTVVARVRVAEWARLAAASARWPGRAGRLWILVTMRFPAAQCSAAVDPLPR